MSCPELPIEDLVAYLDGELPDGESARVAAHLDEHGACRVEADQLRRSGALLEALPGLEPSDGFAGRAVSAARGSAPAGRVLRVPAWRTAAAAAALLAIGGWWALRGDETASDLPGPAAGDTLTAREEQEIAEDLLVLTNLDLLQTSDTDELATLVDDLDVLDWVAAVEEGG